MSTFPKIDFAQIDCNPNPIRSGKIFKLIQSTKLEHITIDCICHAPTRRLHTTTAPRSTTERSLPSQWKWTGWRAPRTPPLGPRLSRLGVRSVGPHRDAMIQSFVDGLVILRRRLRLTRRPVTPSATSGHLHLLTHSSPPIAPRRGSLPSRLQVLQLPPRHARDEPSDAYRTNISATAIIRYCYRILVASGPSPDAAPDRAAA
jgi:hypothetical protein